MSYLQLLIVIYIHDTFTDASFSIDYTKIFLTLLIVLVPCCFGLFCRARNTKKQFRGKFLWKWVEIVGSITGALFLIAAFAYGLSTSYELLWSSWKVIVVCVVDMESVILTFCAVGVASKWTNGAFGGFVRLLGFKVAKVRVGAEYDFAFF